MNVFFLQCTTRTQAENSKYLGSLCCKVKWLDTTEIPEPSKKKTIDLVKVVVLEAALQLHDSLNDSSDTINPLASDLDTSSIDTTTTSLPLVKRKSLFSGYERSKLTTEKTRLSVTETIQDEVSLFMRKPSDDPNLIFKKKNFSPVFRPSSFCSK